jgi:hypothetical protein
VPAEKGVKAEGKQEVPAEKGVKAGGKQEVPAEKDGEVKVTEKKSAKQISSERAKSFTRVTAQSTGAKVSDQAMQRQRDVTAVKKEEEVKSGIGSGTVNGLEEQQSVKEAETTTSKEVADYGRDGSGQDDRVFEMAKAVGKRCA